MGDSSDIDALIKDMNNTNLSNEENSMVNSILNELNSEPNTQQQKPQITNEEKEMLMQQQIQQQKIAQQRMEQQMAQQQQMMQQQMAQQQRQQMEADKKMKESDELSTVDKIKKYLYEYREVIMVLVLSVIFKIDSVSENLTMKNVSYMYNMETGKETFLSILFKASIISVIFLLFKIFMK